MFYLISPIALDKCSVQKNGLTNQSPVCLTRSFMTCSFFLSWLHVHYICHHSSHFNRPCVSLLRTQESSLCFWCCNLCLVGGERKHPGVRIIQTCGCFLTTTSPDTGSSLGAWATFLLPMLKKSLTRWHPTKECVTFVPFNRKWPYSL